MELVFLFSTFSSSILEPNLQIRGKKQNLAVITQKFFNYKSMIKKIKGSVLPMDWEM